MVLCRKVYIILCPYLGRSTISGIIIIINNYTFFSFATVTDGVHQVVPKEIKEEAERYAKESLKESDSEDDD